MCPLTVWEAQYTILWSCTVDGGGGGVDQRHVRGRLHCLEQGDEARHVVAHVALGYGPRGSGRVWCGHVVGRGGAAEDPCAPTATPPYHIEPIFLFPRAAQRVAHALV